MNCNTEVHKTRMADKEEDLTKKQVEIRVSADPESLCIVRSAVHKAAETAGMEQRDVDAVILALEEALANAIRHSYGGPCAEPIVVTVKKIEPQLKQPAALEIVVRDFGRQVDPTQIKGRNLDDVRPGGLGVHIIQSTMDIVEYSCPQEGGMQLRMVKNIENDHKPGPTKT